MLYGQIRLLLDGIRYTKLLRYTETVGIQVSCSAEDHSGLDQALYTSLIFLVWKNHANRFLVFRPHPPKEPGHT